MFEGVFQGVVWESGKQILTYLAFLTPNEGVLLNEKKTQFLKNLDV